MKSIFLIIWVLVIIFFKSEFSIAQTDIPQDTIYVDSTQAINFGLFEKENRKTFKMLFSGKPGKAALYSLIIPGAGHFYNKKYWKIPISMGLVGYFGYTAVQSQIKFHEINFAYKCVLNGGECTYDGRIYDAGTLYDRMDRYRIINERQWVTFSFIYVGQAIWSYIDRHLIDFDMNENLTFKPIITPVGPTLGLALNMNSL